MTSYAESRHRLPTFSESLPSATLKIYEESFVSNYSYILDFLWSEFINTTMFELLVPFPPNRVFYFVSCSPEDGNRTDFRNGVLLIRSEDGQT
jgi:hypothetical protein